jgi:hypothetical protein
MDWLIKLSRTGMKTFKLERGRYTGVIGSQTENDINFCRQEFGNGGVQPDRRWFYRLLEKQHDWRRVGRRSSLKLVLYFRNESDITLFLLKNG